MSDDLYAIEWLSKHMLEHPEMLKVGVRWLFGAMHHFEEAFEEHLRGKR